MAYQSFILSKTKHHKYLAHAFMVFPCGLSCHWMLCWNQRIPVVCMGSNPVSCCDVCGVFFFLLSSCLALQYRVWVPHGLLLKKKCFYANFILRSQIWKWILLFISTEKENMLNQQDNDWQELAIRNTTSSWMSSCLLTVVHRREAHFVNCFDFFQPADLLIGSKLNF